MKHIAPSKPPAVAGFNAAGLEHYCVGLTALCGETALLLRGCAQRVGSGPAARSRRTQWLRGPAATIFRVSPIVTRMGRNRLAARPVRNRPGAARLRDGAGRRVGWRAA
nr:hypothetical protein [Brucella anthropi]